MLDELFAIHHEVMATTPLKIKRYLFEQIHWNAQAICILGSRGVGKTTMMCQAFVQFSGDIEKGLYISADNIHVLSLGLFAIAQEYFKMGGEALYIDEVHKYPDWSLEIKNIIDTYKKKKIVFSASSALQLNQSKYDLSRRVVYYELKGLSFREYLEFAEDLHYPVLSIQALLKQHVKFAANFKELTILKLFQKYLKLGYFPFFTEGEADFIQKVNNIIEKVIFEDVASIYNLRQTTIITLKKLLWLVATSRGLVPNIDKISKNLGVSRESIYEAFEYLELAGLLINVYHQASGMKLARKPGKTYMENTNLLYAINGSLKSEAHIGDVRETFFINQISTKYGIHLHEQGDFMVESNIIIEVGGKSKDFRQIKNHENAYLAVDDIEIGFGKKIPLYLFGFLY